MKAKEVLRSLFNRNYTAERNKPEEAEYYNQQHLRNPAYKKNNWLAQDEKILQKTYGTIIELGCGNGKFCAEASKKADTVFGIDWAYCISTGVITSDNFTFIRADLRFAEIPNGDLICSADVLEHFDFEDAKKLIARCSAKAKYQYHKIACYDDLHSHVAVMPPWTWLEAFRECDTQFYISDIEFRRNKLSQPVITITNISGV